MRRSPLPASEKPLARRHKVPGRKRPRKLARDFLVPECTITKEHHARSTTHLDLVRAMPCIRCSEKWPGERWTIAWKKALESRIQLSEAHHSPGRGPSGGGNDRLTVPLCSAHHDLATRHEIEITRADVAATLYAIECAMFKGRLSPAILVQIAEECNQ